MYHNQRQGAKSLKKGELRIISGKLKGQKCRFPVNIDGLRPTADRIRETLFNWLTGQLDNAVCLDAFSGSGALGFEALSRGAKSCDFIEINTAAIHCLKSNIEKYRLDSAQIIRTDAIRFLKTRSGYSVIFLDPPFQSALLQQALIAIQNNSAIDQATLIYIESSKRAKPEALEGFKLHKSAMAGEVFFALISKKQKNLVLSSI